MSSNIVIVGELRHRITILTKVEVEEANGAATLPIYNEIVTVWGSVESIAGLTRIDTKQIGEEITHRITIRYFKNLTSEHWLKFKNRNFVIKNIKNIDERNQYLEIMVQEVFFDVNYLQASIGQVGNPLNEY